MILNILSAALSMASAIADHKAQAQQSAATKKAANVERRLNIRDLSIRQAEETLAAKLDITAGKDQAQQAVSNAKVSGAAGGIAGSSLSLLIAGISQDQAKQAAMTNTNLTISLDQLERMKAGANATADNRIAGAPKPSRFATGLRIGGAALDYAISRVKPI